MSTSLFRAMLKPSEIKQFKRDGHLIVRGAFAPATLIDLGEKLEHARSEGVLANDAEARKDPNAFFWRRSAEIAKFVLDPGLGEVVSDLLDVDGVKLIHESLFEKKVGASNVKWHRDSFFWSYKGAGAVTVWIPLQDTPISMSPLRYASGSHRERNTRRLGRLEEMLVPLRYPVAISPLKLGDIIIHHAEVLHGATRKKDPTTRKALSLHLFDKNARVLHTTDPVQHQHAQRCGWDKLEGGVSFPEHIAPTVFDRSNASMGNVPYLKAMAQQA